MLALGGNIYVSQMLTGQKPNVGACGCPVTFDLSPFILCKRQEILPQLKQEFTRCQHCFKVSSLSYHWEDNCDKERPKHSLNYMKEETRLLRTAIIPGPSTAVKASPVISFPGRTWQGGQPGQGMRTKGRLKRYAFHLLRSLSSSPFQKALKLFSSDFIMQILILLSW